MDLLETIMLAVNDLTNKDTMIEEEEVEII